MDNYFDEVRFELDDDAFYRFDRFGDFIGIKKMVARTLPIVFGSLRHHWKLFWTVDDINQINDFYHDALIKLNGFPVQALDFFTPKQYREEIKNSFFIDCSSDEEFLLAVIKHVRYNHCALEEIISRGLSFNLSDDVIDFYNGITDYLENELKKGNLESVPKSSVNSRFRPYYNNFRLEDEKVFEEAVCSVCYTDVFETPSDTKPIIKDIAGSRLSCSPPKEHNLLPSSLKLLKERLDGIEKADLRTCLNLLENYPCFVEEKDYEKFKRDLEKSQVSFNSLYDDLAVEGARKLIKKYYSSLAVGILVSDLIESKNAKILIEFREKFRHSEEWQDPARICFFIDCLSYCYKKGKKYLVKEGYCKLNAIMRHIDHHYSLAYWYCFDPMVEGQWREVYDHHAINDLNREKFCDALKATVEQNIIIKGSFLFLDVFKIASEQNDFNTAKAMIRDAFDKHLPKKKK